MTPFGASVLGLVLGLLSGFVPTVVLYERRFHRRWLDDFELRHGADARALVEAEWAAGRWDRAPRRWVRRWAP